MSGNRLSIGVIGCGRVAVGFHLPALQHISGANVTALADIDSDKLAAAGLRFGVERRYTDYRHLLDLPDLDIVAICTPTPLHVPMALAALAAHKHVLVEKPLALSLDEIHTLEQAAAASDRKITVGFVLRHHRLLVQAKAAVALGVLGTVESIQTHWTIPVQFRGSLPEWRKRRATGGGALIDFAVHHIDLWRYLLATEVESVYAQAHAGRAEDQTITLNARLTNGVLATTTISEASTDSHEIHLFGHLGALHVSCYRFDGLSLEPIFSPASAARQWLRQVETLARELPNGFSGRGEGGEYGRAFFNEWTHFIEAIQTNTDPQVSLRDGLQATRVLLAAAQSAEEDRPIRVADAPPTLRLPTPIQPVEFPLVREAVTPPELSVIIVTNDNFEGFHLLLRSLRAQTVADQLEVVIVAPAVSWLDLEESWFASFAAYRVIEIGTPRSLSDMQTHGVFVASAPVVVFSEDHCFPEPDWAEKLIARHREGYSAVSPIIRNGNPFSAISWADALVAYGAYLEPLTVDQARKIFYLPWHHTSYKRDELLAYGDGLYALMEVANVLHDRMRASGQRLLIDPEIVISHIHVTRLMPWLVSLFMLGRLFAGYRGGAWTPAHRIVYALGSPLLPLLRGWRTLRILWRDPARRSRILPVAFWLTIGLSASALGEFIGYTVGAGSSGRYFMAYEFHRWWHTNPSDWAAMMTRLPKASKEEIPIND